jgi:hypothetical protein
LRPTLIVEHDNPEVAHGIVNGQMFIDGQPINEWFDSFFPDSDKLPKPETFGYCKECGKPLCECDYWFWSEVLEFDEEYEGFCIGCLCRLAEDP